jgi:glycosyltransferase involved in cell wall biosynthesis
MLRITIYFLVLFYPLFTYAKDKICLNMIVKNESEVIKRCLDSVKPHIDYWVIVDTGSTDGTQKIIKNYMKGIPGKLYERPWKNWGETRTEALNLAQGKGDYILFMDADDILEFQDGKAFEKLTEDLYEMWRGSNSFSYLKTQLVKDGLPWKWVGVTHEYLDSTRPYTSGILNNVRYLSLDGGATWKDPKQKFLKNVELLEAGLKKEPTNARYAFYLAESYRDAGEKAKALEWYQKRIKMGGWAEETFYSTLQAACMLKELGLPPPVLIEAYQAAFRIRPHRAESIYFLAELFIEQGNYAQAYTLLKTRELIIQPAEKDKLFNMNWIEDYGLTFQLSICSYYIDKNEEGLAACTALLANPNLPESWRTQTEKNRQFYLIKLEELNQKTLKM